MNSKPMFVIAGEQNCPGEIEVSMKVQNIDAQDMLKTLYQAMGELIRTGNVSKDIALKGFLAEVFDEDDPVDAFILMKNFEEFVN